MIAQHMHSLTHLSDCLRAGRSLLVLQVASHFADVAQPVLALDHAFNILALPSLLDAGT